MRQNFLILLISVGWAGPLWARNTATATPLQTPSPTPKDTDTPTQTPFPTATPYVCSFPYGVTVTGGDQPSKGWAYESPLSLSLPAKVEEVHAYASQAETLVAGLYDGSDNLVKAVTLQAPGGGWQTADFPATLKAGRYYLAESGTGASMNLAPGAGMDCFYDPKGTLDRNFHRSGHLSSGVPLYLTGSRPQVIQGLLFGVGSSILRGDNLSGGSGKGRFIDLFADWLNEHYGPVTLVILGNPGLETAKLALSAEEMINGKIGGRKADICVLEFGMINLENSGGPDSSNCGNESLVSGVSSALHYRDDLQGILSVVQKHMAPGGTIFMVNLHEADDYFNVIHPGWKDYPAILQVYNTMIADVAKANGARLVDDYTLMASNPAFRDSINMHPNPIGHAAIANLFEKAVEEGLLAPAGKSPGGR